MISLDDQHDGVVDLPHHLDLYISAIQTWIEAAYASTYQFGKKFDDIIVRARTLRIISFGNFVVVCKWSYGSK